MQRIYELAKSKDICQAYTIGWAEAVLSNESHVFISRIKVMQQKSASMLTSQVDMVKNKIKKAGEDAPLTSVEINLLTIPAFLDKIELFRYPAGHARLFGKPMAQSNIEEISMLASSQSIIDAGGLAVSYSEPFIFTMPELKVYLEQLFKMLASLPIDPSRENNVLLLNDYGHTTGFSYNQRTQKIQFLDLNQNNGFPIDIATIDHLIECIKIAFKPLKLHEANAFLPCNIKLLTVKKNSVLATWQKALLAFKESSKQDITEEIAQRCNQTTLLFVAARDGHVNTVNDLLKRSSIDVNSQTGEIPSPLFIAVQNGHLEVVKALLKHKDININQLRYDGVSPLYFAAQSGYIDIVTCLLSHRDAKNQLDINLNIISPDTGATALFRAAQFGHTYIVKLLLAQPNIKLDIITTTGTTALYIAAQNGHDDIVKALLPYTDEKMLNHTANNGTTALLMAAQKGHTRVVKALTEYPEINLDQTNPQGATALFLATIGNHLETVNILINKKNIDCNVGPNGMSPLFAAAQNNQLEMLQILISHSNIDVYQPFKNTVADLMKFATDNHVVDAMTKKIREKVVTPDNMIALTPLDIAEIMKHEKVIALLSTYMHTLENTQLKKPTNKGTSCTQQ